MANNPQIQHQYTLLWCILGIILGIGMIIVAFFNEDFPEEIFLSDKYKDYKDYFYLSLMIQGSLFIAVSLIAIICFFCNCRFWKIASIIVNFLFFISFLVVLATSVDGKKLLNQQMSDDQCSQGNFKEINEAFIEFGRIWCRTPCPCKITNQLQWDLDQREDLQNLFLFPSISSSGTETLQECPYFKEQFNSERYNGYVEFFNALEQHLECTGVCQGDLVYYFTGINNGHPISDEGCLHALKEKIESWLSLIFVSSLVAVIICFVNILIIISSALLPKKRKHQTKEEMAQPG